MKRGQYNKRHPKHFDFGASLRKPFGESSLNRIIRQYKKSAKYRGLVFKLSEKRCKELFDGLCFYCGVKPFNKMQLKDANGYYIYNGIDRKNNSLGYTIRNCVSCCIICNRAKANLSYKNWLEYIERLKCNINFQL